MSKTFILKYFLLFFTSLLLAQKNETIISADFNIGKTMPANEYFHEMNPFKGFSISYGLKQNDTIKNWANFLKHPTTGVSFQYNDFGNTDKVGRSFALIPFIEMPLNKKRNLDLHLGLGISYFTVLHNPETNWFNRGISTRYNWAFRKFIYFNFINQKHIAHRLGFGFIHHSNGHVNWPNQGLNTFVLAYNVQFSNQKSICNFFFFF